MEKNNENSHASRSVEDIVLYVPLMLLVAVVVALFIFRLISDRAREHRRQMCVYNPSHAVFTRSSALRSFFHRHLLHAPICGHRHNLEYRLFERKVILGTVPSRIQALFLLTYTALNVALCVGTMPFSRNSPDSVLRRLSSNTGILAVANLIPLVITAGRNNPLIPLLRTSYYKFNLVHRWLGRIVVAESLAHTVGMLIIASKRRMLLGAGLVQRTIAYMDTDGWNRVPYVLATVDVVIFGVMVRPA